MSELKSIVVLYGGVGSEREVSLVSGEAIAKALSAKYPVDLRRLDENCLPADIDGERSIVFPALHGSFGEDGQLQELCDAAGVICCGSGASASRLCMAKDQAKVVAGKLGIATPKGLTFEGAQSPLADEVIQELGESLVIKPADEGSSIGLHFTEHRSALGVTLSQIHSGNWLIEQRIRGRELTVGILNGKAMGIVEIISPSGVYNFKAKYTPGSTEYRFPAELEPGHEAHIKDAAERLFEACGCRDFARIDFLLDADGPYFLEINTLPGLTPTSLLPKSASCAGFGFEELASELVAPAIERFKEKRKANPTE
ncbi:MAG: D-alanine--D-alanine ligase family protein [Opitutaceae bacterium]